LRIASLKLSVSPSPTPPELPATATPTMSLETTGIVVGAAVVAGAVVGGAGVVPGVVVCAVTAVVVGWIDCAGADVEALRTTVVVASCDVTSRSHAAGTNASTTIPNARRVLIATSCVDDRVTSRRRIFVVPPVHEVYHFSTRRTEGR
jgi:hypothetical protein